MISRAKWCILILLILLCPAIRCDAAETVSGGDAVIETTPTETEPIEEEIPVTELDLGDCPRELPVGTSQMISVLVIPADATDVKFTYTSDNPEIASINALGRLTGHKVGTTRITVTCGGVSGSFSVAVTEDTTNIPVQDIEIEEVEDELKVDSKISISTTVLPIDATNSKITYHSSDTSIATVNSSGQVKGIAPGQVTIEVRAGNVVKKIPITVKIGTTGIRLNRDYLVLKPEETFQLETEVEPKEVSANITYKSLDTDVATVSSNGLITAKACGNTAIVVSNDDLQVTISVIVNEEANTESIGAVIDIHNNTAEKLFSNQIDTENYPIISADMLKFFYEKGKVLTVDGEGYAIHVDGNKIVNFDNQLETQLFFQEEKDGFSFIVNGGNDLCGKIIIDLNDKITDQKYLYLYNEAKQKYEQLKTDDISWLSVDTGGKYLVSSQKISELNFNPMVIVCGVIIVLAGVVAYIGVKK